MRVRDLLALTLPVLLWVSCRSPTDEVEDPGQTGDAARMEWLRNNVIPVRTVQPADEDFTDLAPLADVIGDSRIVLLGEQAHGEGTTFLAKTRLIKYLHRELGFDVLAFESGLYDVPRIWALIQDGMPALEAIRLGVFDNWTGSEQFLPLIDYVGETVGTSSPLELTGFDMQISGFIAGQRLVADLEAMLDAHGLGRPISGGWDAFAGLLDRMAHWAWVEGDPDAQTLEAFLAAMEELKGEVRREVLESGDSDLEYWEQLLESLATEARMNWSWIHEPELRWDAWEIRDEQMARNFLWLARRRFPDRKIMGWLATGHAMRGLPEIGNNPELVNMGAHLWPELGNELYVLGFTAYEGSWGGWWYSQPIVLQPAPAGSLEDYLRRTGFELAILDFRSRSTGGEWLDEPISARPHGHVSLELVWPDHLHGMMFTHTMEPSTEASR